MKSTAAVAHSLRSPFVVEEVDLPDLRPTDILVRSVAVGLPHRYCETQQKRIPGGLIFFRGSERASSITPGLS